jgi:putative methionine-R-sulfoxide reductase with GAF domain
VQRALEEILRRFDAETGTIHLLEGRVLVLRAHVGLPPHIAAIVERVPVGKGMAGAAAERNAPVASCDLQTDGSGDVRPAARDTGVNGAIVVPMRDAAGRVRGTLGIGVHRPYVYRDEEIARLLIEAAALP